MGQGVGWGRSREVLACEIINEHWNHRTHQSLFVYLFSEKLLPPKSLF